ncbi:MAG: DUF3822 family protein [Bacteroidales bacterium]|nr:DUF3822 family protein [Bacteroidales bacterium]MBN2819909.1 DUF3822 family protein [Bacteroidales bacterium]
MPDINFVNPQINNIKNQEISIQASLGGFSFCINNSESGECLAFRNYKFENTLLEDELIRKINKITDSENFLANDFNKIRITYFNQSSTLIPEEFFDVNNLRKYFEFSQSLEDLDEIHYNKISEITLYNVFSIPNYLTEIFYTLYPNKNIEFTHQASKLIRLGLSLHAKNNTCIIISLNSHFFDLVVFEDGELALSNSYQYANDSDFVYFFLYAMKQLKINNEEQEVYVLGEMMNDKNITKELSKYTKKIIHPEIHREISNSLSINSQQKTLYYSHFV